MASRVDIFTPSSPADLDDYRTLVRAYASAAVFKVDWQKLEQDLESLPGEFSPPDGLLLLAKGDGIALGCVALRRFDACQVEMKRLYVAPAARGTGLGYKLAAQIGDEARALGYTAVLLDTYTRTPGAIRLYERLHYKETPPYCFNPEPDTRYYRLAL